MQGMSIVEVAIGLVFIYVLLSMLCTLLNEWIARLFSLRSKNLEKGLKQLLADPDNKGLTRAVLGHHLIQGSVSKKGRPSYISSENFSRVLIDIIDKKQASNLKATTTLKTMEAAIKKAKLPKQLESALTGLIDSDDKSIKDLRRNLQTWFDNSMGRVSGWYKRKMQIVSLIVAAVLTIGLNVDTIAVGQTLWKDPLLRAQIADQAAIAVEACKGMEKPEECLFLKEGAKTREGLMQLPIGWPCAGDGEVTFWSLVSKVVGWLITALAVSLGAPFWFGVLDKLNSIRSAGSRPKETSSTA